MIRNIEIKKIIRYDMQKHFIHFDDWKISKATSAIPLWVLFVLIAVSMWHWKIFVVVWCNPLQNWKENCHHLVSELSEHSVFLSLLLSTVLTIIFIEMIINEVSSQDKVISIKALKGSLMISHFCHYLCFLKLVKFTN